MMNKIIIYLLMIIITTTKASFPDQAKWSFKLKNERTCHYLSAHSSLYSNSSIHLQISCDMPIISKEQYKIIVGLMIRSSPCFEEYFDSEYWAMSDYFNWYYHCPLSSFGDYGYKTVDYYKSEELEFQCNHLIDLKSLLNGKQFTINESIIESANQSCHADMDTFCDSSSSTIIPHYSSDSDKTHQIKNGHSIIIPNDGNYLFILFIRFTNQQQPLNITVDVNFQSNTGEYLSAIDYPLLQFYGVMSFVYFIFAIIWFIQTSVNHWQDLLKIQFFIAIIILLGMIEMAIYFGCYQSINVNGTLNRSIFYMGELFSCLKRTLARVLLIIVSSGFEIIRPHLGSSNQNKILTIGIVYFLLATFNSTIKIFKHNKNNLTNGQYLFAEIPLALLDSIIIWWIFTNLCQTIKILRLRRNYTKLKLFNNLTNVLIISVIASVAFMIWQIHNHKLTSCVRSWKYLWIDEAYWHVLFSLIFLSIMILWRPTNNNQRYASNAIQMMDGDSEDELINQSSKIIDNGGEMKMRFHHHNKSQNNELNDDIDVNNIISEETENHLKWLEENIKTTTTLSSTTMPSIMDSDEELINLKFEVSKIQ